MINRKVALPLLMGLLGVSLVGAVAFGTFPVSFAALLAGDLSQQQVVTAIRLPRVLLGAVVGAALAVSGAALQGLFRNPLADPGLVGISAGAALAVGFAIVFMEPFLHVLGLYGLSIAAFAGGLLTCLVIFRFAKVAGVFSVTHMLLAGIAINAIAAAGIGVLTYLSDDQQLRTLIFWTMGNLGGAFWSPLLVATTIVVPAILALIKNAAKLNLLLLGEEEAVNLGVNAERLKLIVIFCSALAVGAAVAAAGIIGFVGLVVPHLIRLTLGPDNRLLIPAGALLGATLLVVADGFARTIVSPAEMPVGILTSLIGGPFFLWLLMKQYSIRLR